jgi:hypothetical protein
VESRRHTAAFAEYIADEPNWLDIMYDDLPCDQFLWSTTITSATFPTSPTTGTVVATETLEYNPDNLDGNTLSPTEAVAFHLDFDPIGEFPPLELPIIDGFELADEIN